MRHDVVVVGNGPAGCVTAEKNSADNDIAVVGLKDRRVECAGLISKSGMERIGVKPGEFILNTLRGARIFSPGGVKIEVDGGSPKAYAVDRLAFDNHLLNRAVGAGATYVDDVVSSINGGVKLRSGTVVEADRIVLATGTDYTLQKKAGMDYPREFLFGGQYEMKVECDQEFVELYFTVPDFFAWVIPLGDRARVGLCVKSNPRPYLNSFVKKLSSDGRLKSDKVLAESFGIIPIHRPSMRTQYKNIVAVGDAAAQVKVSTGGGIIFGAVAAEYACSPDYERLWRREIGFDLKLHLMIHRLLARLPPKGKDRLFRIIKENHNSLERSGDMDYAAKTLSGLAASPRFLTHLLTNAPWLVRDMIF
ncbi:MAG: NAD(P)/FAD-dependent oxidoreductase [Candidatus Altiarchaeota archaeon]